MVRGRGSGNGKGGKGEELFSAAFNSWMAALYNLIAWSTEDLSCISLAALVRLSTTEMALDVEAEIDTFPTLESFRSSARESNVWSLTFIASLICRSFSTG